MGRLAGNASGRHAHKTAIYVQRGVKAPAGSGPPSKPGCPFLLLEVGVLAALVVRAVSR